MRKYHKLLFYYGILASTAAFFYILIFTPRPENFLVLLLLLPIPLYFWTQITPSPLQVGEGSASLGSKIFLYVLLGVLISTISIFSNSYLISSQESSPKNLAEKISANTESLNKLKSSLEGLNSNTDQSQLSKKLEEVTSEVDSLKLLKQVLGTSEQPSPASDSAGQKDSKILGFVSLAGNTPVDLFTDSSFASKIVGKAESGKSYPYKKRVDNWYKITLPDATEAWVFDRFVKESKQ